MIAETIIEQVITELSESKEVVESRFLDNHRIFFDYLHNEIFSALDEELQSQLYFYITVIHESYYIANGALPQFSIEEYFENEDLNWKTSESHSGWEASVNAFFKDYPEEDILAFVEDMLSEIEDNANNSVGTEVVFIVAKSYIDTICDI